MKINAVLCLLLAFVLILSAVWITPTSQAARVSLILTVHPTSANVGETVRISGETEPRLDGFLIFIPYMGIGTPQVVKEVPVEMGEISLEWFPSKPGSYMLVIIFVPESRAYETAVSVLNVKVSDVRLTVSVEDVFYSPGETVKVSIGVAKSDGTVIPYAKVSAVFNERTVEVLTDLEGAANVEFKIPEDAAGEYTINVNCPPAQSSVKIYVNLLSRISQIRELPFKHTVPVDFITVDEYKEEFKGWMENVSEKEWELAQQEYEALYILEEGVNVRDVSEAFWTGAVLGYYDPADDHIVIVTREGWAGLSEEITVHELIHALTDQHFPEIYEYEFNLTDRSFALSALLEGDAETVKDIYITKFFTSNNKLGDGESDAAVQIPAGFQFIQYFPYIEGVNFISELKDRGGWDAVNKAYIDIPRSTEQIIHPEKYGVDAPTDVEVDDNSGEDWIILGRDTLGEFAIFVMFWNQGIVQFTIKDWRYTYSSNASEGWDGDEIVVYKEKNGDRYGYVWQIVWDSGKDAKEFLDAYEWMLWSMDAVFIEEEGVWKVDSNDFIKIIEEEETLITIVNAPSPEEFKEIYPSSEV